MSYPQASEPTNPVPPEGLDAPPPAAKPKRGLAPLLGVLLLVVGLIGLGAALYFAVVAKPTTTASTAPVSAPGRTARALDAGDYWILQDIGPAGTTSPNTPVLTTVDVSISGPDGVVQLSTPPGDTAATDVDNTAYLPVVSFSVTTAGRYNVVLGGSGSSQVLIEKATASSSGTSTLWLVVGAVSLVAVLAGAGLLIAGLLRRRKNRSVASPATGEPESGQEVQPGPPDGPQVEQVPGPAVAPPAVPSPFMPTVSPFVPAAPVVPTPAGAEPSSLQSPPAGAPVSQLPPPSGSPAVTLPPPEAVAGPTGEAEESGSVGEAAAPGAVGEAATPGVGGEANAPGATSEPEDQSTPPQATESPVAPSGAPVNLPPPAGATAVPLPPPEH